MSNSSYYDLIIGIKIWEKQRKIGNNLIDYNQKGLEKEQFKINSSGYLIFSSNKIRFSKILEENKEKILIIEKEKNNMYYIDCKHFKKGFNYDSGKFGAFMVYRSNFFNKDEDNKNKMYKLDKGDIIRLGKLFIRILDIKLEKKIATNFPSYNYSFKNQKLLDSNSGLSDVHNIKIFPRINSAREFRNKNIKNKICRICYENYSSIKNPLINPCKCKGSMKYIHYNCLLNWMKNRIIIPNDKINSNNHISFDKSLLNCELCKNNFPYYINYKNNIYNILPFLSKFNEYLLFETLDRNGKQMINIFSLVNKNKISIGRSPSNNIYFYETSLSRSHSIIHKDAMKSEIYIEDNNSRFSTLILIQNNKIEINEHLPLRLQIDSIYIKIKKKLNKIYSCCNVNTAKFIEEKKEYQNQNKNNEINKNINGIKNLESDSFINSSENNEEDNENEINNYNFHNKEKLSDINNVNDREGKIKDNEITKGVIDTSRISLKTELSNRMNKLIGSYNKNFYNFIKKKPNKIEINEKIKKYERNKSLGLLLDLQKKTIKNKENKFSCLKLKNLDKFRIKEESLFSLFFSKNKSYLNQSKKNNESFSSRNIFITNKMQ